MHAHLSVKVTLGIDPLLPEETSWFLAADLDKQTWREDAAAFRETGRERQMPAV